MGKLGVNLSSSRSTGRRRTRVFARSSSGLHHSWTNDIPDPSQLAAYELRVHRASRIAAVQVAEMDGLLARRMRETNLEKRADYYEMQELALGSPLIWLYYSPYTIAINKKMKDSSSWPPAPGSSRRTVETGGHRALLRYALRRIISDSARCAPGPGAIFF